MGAVTVNLGKLGDYDPLEAHPIGCVYMSFEPTSPAELFGGTWLKIDGYFLRAANNTNTGGQNEVTLTVGQMPSHSHYGEHDGAFAGVSAYGNDLGVNTSGQTGSTGGSQPHSNMPLYQNVYTWRRTA